MTAIPATFRAYVVEKVPDADPARVERGVRDVHERDLPAGEVEVRVTIPGLEQEIAARGEIVGRRERDGFVWWLNQKHYGVVGLASVLAALALRPAGYSQPMTTSSM